MNDDIHINNGYRLRPAAMDEIPVIWEIILQAKAQMYREGKHQWDENYPTVPILENDVRRGWGYVLVPEKDTPLQNVYDEATPFFNDIPARTTGDPGRTSSPTEQWHSTESLPTRVCGTVSG